MEISDKILNLKTWSKSNYIPIVRDKTVEKICEIIKEENCCKILEIGTAVGYSGILMLQSNPNAHLTTIEKDGERFNQAQKNFLDFDLSNRVSLILNDAKTTLERLEKCGDKFDFIFLDGPKGQYIKYLPILKKLLKINGILFADNILLGGLIKQSQVSHKNRTMATNMKKFIEEITQDSDFETSIYEIDDGFSISKLKKSIEQ